MTAKEDRWNEETLSETPAVELLESLGYKYLSSEEIEPLREGERSSILTKTLQESLLDLNPWLTEDNLNRALRTITKINAVNLIEANEQAYNILTRGTTVLQDLGSGMTSQTVRLIDFDHPEENQYLVTRQFTIKGSQVDIIANIIVFVNGLPLAVIECQSPFINYPINEAINQLLRYQEAEEKWQGRGAPQAFNPVQILIGICREQAVFGSIGSPARYYAGFPEPYPMNLDRFRRLLDREPTPQDILLYSLLDKENLLEYTRNLVAYDIDKGRKIKKLARYQQRIAIDQAIARILTHNEPIERGGVVWHTQGSGKSLTMIWLAQKLRQDSLGLNNPTIVIVTDRIELDAQITGTFQRVGFPNPQRAESVKNLRELWQKGEGMTILTTVQKFYDATRSKKPLNSSSNVFVLVDEAHRTQYGLMAARMRKALANATFIAFTGTPIDKKDRSTLQEFGSYIHKYPIAQSVKDKATVPIFYESRDLEKFGVWGNGIDILFKRYFGQYSPEEQEKIKSRYATSTTIASAPQRVAAIASDLVAHFKKEIHINGFKGQIVTVNREAAVRYKAELDKLDAPESVVIFTSSHNDNKELAAHRTTPAERKQLIERFKNPKDPLSLIIVVDMLLTGFDAPIEQVMYLDAPLKEHNLLQAIARVNRPYEGKEAGFIVDYWGVSQHLSEALSLFDENELGQPMQPKERELPVLERHHRSAMRIFEGCDLVRGEALRDRNDYEALLKIIEPEDIRTKFDRAYRAFASSLNLLYPDPKALDYEEDFKWLSKIRQAASNRFRDSNLDWDHIATKVRQIIDDNLIASAIEQVLEPISILNIEFDRNLETLPSDAAKASEIAHAIRYEISERETENPVFYASLRERLEKIVQQKQEQRISYSEQLKQLINLKGELRTGITTAAKKLQLNKTSFAFYQLLEENKIDKAIALELAPEIEQAIAELIVIDWVQKEDVQREMRKRLRRLLIAQKIPRKEAEPIILKLMDVARVNLG